MVPRRGGPDAGGPGAGRSLIGSTLDLVSPLECAGCTVGGVAWCAACDCSMSTGPVRVRARDMPADMHFEPHRHAWGQLAYCASGVIQVSVHAPAAAAAAPNIASGIGRSARPTMPWAKTITAHESMNDDGPAEAGPSRDCV